jgi:hypothetical protein
MFTGSALQYPLRRQAADLLAGYGSAPPSKLISQFNVNSSDGNIKVIN